MRNAIGRALLLFLITLMISGCTTLWQDYFEGHNARKGVSSSLVDYLYPDGTIPPKHDQNIPHLEVPLHIGLAFVPAGTNNTPGLTEASKAQLLEQVRQRFADRDFISEITIIPDTYLRSSKGFEGVDQIARLYGLDVMALVSYDQVANSDDNKASIFYWTIVGAYLIKGSDTDVQTFVDTAIFDINTHKLLFRAPGVHREASSTTLVGSGKQLREAREQSFAAAMADMTGNLETELDSFRERIKQDKSVTVSYRDSYRGGGGAFDLAALVFLLVCVLALRPGRRREA
ncbi:MAG TPA: rhombotarget lipoprotein [Gammaproteobacteria bacterium]|nr:rhombotarget lipoprotein [Gammaproteobacteria bacterium]